MTATIIAQSTSVVPPVVTGAAQPAQVSTLSAPARLVPRLLLLTVSIVPPVVLGAATATAQSTLVARAIPAPSVRVLAVWAGAGAATGTQRTTLAAVGTTGPIPRAVQTTTLQAPFTLALPGAFALPVPRRSLAALSLLTLQGAAASTQVTWLIAGVVPVTDAATLAQQGTLVGSAQVVVPHAGSAVALATRTATVARTVIAHPLVFWALPGGAARPRAPVVAHASLSALCHLRGGGPVRARFAARSRALSFRATAARRQRVFVAPARTLAFRSARRAGGGSPVAMQPAQVGPPYTLRTGEQNQKVVADFAGAALSAGESITAVTVTIMGRPLPGGRAVDLTQTMTGSASPAPCTLVGTTAICYVSTPPAGYGFVFYFYATTNSSPPRVIEEYSPLILNDTPL